MANRERTHGEGFATRAIHAGEAPEPITHAHNTPIYATATFAFDTAAEKEAAVDAAMAGDPTAYFYSRTGNPTTRALEEKLASLDGAEDAIVASSGMACVSSTLLAHLGSGDHVVVGDELFIITRILLEEDFPRRGIGVTPVDMTDLAAVEAAITPQTKVLFFETATNPRLRVADIDALAALGHKHGLIVVADNTFLAPFLLRPIEHGADLVVHAATKWLSGHGDTVAGAVTGSKDLLTPIRKQVDTLGQAASPFASWLVLRGVRSLPLRSRQSSENAAQLARWLEAQPKVEWVRYPGLASHPDHEVADRLIAGPGGPMLSFRMHGGIPAMTAFTDNLALCDVGVSLGDLFTLVYPQPKRDGLIRVSVGCEDIADLIADFERGLSFVS
ncbi:MAG TPA: PLP-dependent aspartate aminotransferase family protein [Candidatus Limnocylindrales bacterium]|nr:PLP-dependent aspartate aminotransferase family protein [Candidatus Limnocylindrales bacterium]